MSGSVAKEAVRKLLEEVIARNPTLDQLRGIALFDPERDAVIKSLSAFDPAAQAVKSIPNFVGRFGTGAGDRIVLQFVYQYFGRVGADSEIGFKLSFRAAALLASDDQQRGGLLKQMKEFYDTRSKAELRAMLTEAARNTARM